MMATMARVTRLILKEWVDTEDTEDTEEMKDLVEEAKKTEEMKGSTIQERIFRFLLGGGCD